MDAKERAKPSDVFRWLQSFDCIGGVKENLQPSWSYHVTKVVNGVGEGAALLRPQVDSSFFDRSNTCCTCATGSLGEPKNKTVLSRYATAYCQFTGNTVAFNARWDVIDTFFEVNGTRENLYSPRRDVKALLLHSI